MKDERKTKKQLVNELVEMRKRISELGVSETERKRAEQTLYLDESRLEVLYRLSQMSKASLNEIGSFALDQGIKLTGSRIGFLGFLSEDESVYTLHAVSKNVMQECKVVGDPTQWHISEAGIWADAVRQRKTLIVNDYTKPYPSKKGVPEGHFLVEKLLVVPVFDNSKIIAVAGVGNKTSDYDKNDERQLSLLMGGMWSYVQRNQVEETLRKAHDELELRVEERTAELVKANEQLRQEIEDRKRAEEQIQQQNEFLNNTLESLTHPFYVIDANDYTIKMANSAARLGDLSGNPTCYALTHKSSKPCGTGEHPCPLEEVKKTKRPVTMEHIHYDEDGNVRNVAVHGFPIFGNEGNVVQMIEYCLDIAQRKQAEEALRKSERKHKELADLLPQIAYETDKKGNLTFRNRYAFESFGYTQEDFDRGLNVLQILIPEDRDRARENMRRRLSGEELAGVEYTAHKKDGSTFPVIVYANPIIHQDKPVGLRGIAVDITERKQAEEALRESEERYRSLVENIDLGITLINTDHGIVMMNAALGRLLNKPAGEFVGKKCFREFEKREAVCSHCPGTRAMAARRPAEVETEGVRDDGTRFPVRVQAFPTFGSDGAVTGFIELVENITERKRAETEAKELRRQIEFILGATKTGLDIIDSEFNIRYIDEEWGKVYGDPTGKKCYEYFMGRSEVCPGCGIPKALETKTITVTEEVLVKENNRPIQVTTLPFQDENGEWLVAEVNVDITERKQAEEQIKTSLKEKEILLREIHHRVKNNMQVISSLLSLQAGHIKDKRVLDVFNESGNRIRAMALIHERLYRSEGLVYIDFGEYIRYLALNLFRSYQVNSEAVTLKVNADGVSLDVDTAIPCGLIINELVSNSLKHAFPEGQTGEICIDLNSDDNKFTLVVSDNGVGLPKDLDFKNTESLGLQLVNTLTGQINGSIELDTCPPSQLVGGRRGSGGTAFKIIFSR